MNKETISKFFNFFITVVLAVFLLSCLDILSGSNDPSSSGGSDSGGSGGPGGSGPGGPEPNLTFEGPAPDAPILKENLILREVTNVLLSEEAGNSPVALANMEIGGNKYLLAAGDRGLDIYLINDETANRNGNLLTLERRRLLGVDGILYLRSIAFGVSMHVNEHTIKDVATQTIGGQQYIFLVQRDNSSSFNPPTFLRAFTIDASTTILNALDVTRVSEDIAASIRNDHVSLTNTISIHTKTISGTTYLFAVGGTPSTSYSLGVFRVAAASGGGFSLTHVQDLDLVESFGTVSISGEISIGGSEYLELKNFSSSSERFLSIAANGRLTPVTGNSLGTVDASRLINGSGVPFTITADGDAYFFFEPKYVSVANVLVEPVSYQPFEVMNNKLVEVRMPNNRVALETGAYQGDIVTETIGGRHYIFGISGGGVSAVEFVTQFVSTAN